MKTISIAAILTLFAVPAFAAGIDGYSFTSITDFGLIGLGSSLGAGLAISLAAIGGGIGQGRTATAALEGIARNPAAQPKIFVPMIIALALIESLVIYALVVAFGLNGVVTQIVEKVAGVN